jgi:hypothetical protein
VFVRVDYSISFLFSQRTNFFLIRPARQSQCYALLMLRVTMRQCRVARHGAGRNVRFK